MKIEIRPGGHGHDIEIPDELVAILERIANPLMNVDVTEGELAFAHELGPLVPLGSERATMVRPGWVAQVARNVDGTATITTTKGFVMKVDEDYKSVQEKLGGRPKTGPVLDRLLEREGDQADAEAREDPEGLDA